MLLRLGALMCLFFFCVSLGPSSAQRSIRAENTISVFGNWRIDLFKENRSLQLVGTVTEGEGGYFSLQCFAEEADKIAILVPMFDDRELAAARKRSIVRITAWNELGGSVTVTMLVFEGVAGFAIADKQKLAEQDGLTKFAFAFLAKLKEAKVFFAFEAGGPTRTYDARHLSAARDKFERSCAEIRADWDKFIAQL